MATWDRDNAPTWQSGAEADQLGWANELTGEILVSTKPNSINTNFLNQEERAQALAWVKAGLLVPSEAGFTGALESIVITNKGYGYTSTPTLTVVGDGTAGTATPTLETAGSVVLIALNLAGIGYAIGDALLINDGTGSGAKIVVDTIGGSGEILTFTQLNSGVDYAVDAVGVAPTTILAATGGTGATFDTTVGFGLASIAVGVPGSEYVPNQTTLTIPASGNEPIGFVASAQVLVATIGSGDFTVMRALAISRM